MGGVSGGDRRRAMAERTTILRAKVGSGAHGVALPGTDDRDEMAVCIEDIDAAVGVSHFPPFLYPTTPHPKQKHQD